MVPVNEQKSLPLGFIGAKKVAVGKKHIKYAFRAHQKFDYLS